MQKERAGYIEGIVSLIANTILFVLKYWAGIVSGSVALIADAWHTLSDSVSSLIVIFGVKMSSKKADKQHPYGHGRWEEISSIFIGFLLSLVAYDFLVQSVHKFQAHESANFGTVAIVVTVVSILGKEAMAQMAFKLGKMSGNSTVKADAWHHRSDALSSVVVLIGIFLKDYFWWIDSALGLVISLLLFYAVFQIVKSAINKLLGEKPSEELLAEIEKVVCDACVEEVQPHDYKLHDYGSHKELTFHIKIDKNLSIDKGHEMATKIENRIREDLNIEPTIHIEPKE